MVKNLLDSRKGLPHIAFAPFGFPTSYHITPLPRQVNRVYLLEILLWCSGAAGVSSPSTIHRAMRSGYEAFKQYSNLVQNGADKIISSTRLPSVDKDGGLLCHSSLTTKALKPFLFLYILAKVR